VYWQLDIICSHVVERLLSASSLTGNAAELTGIIKSVHNQPKSFDPFYIVRSLFHIPMPCVDIDTGRWIEMTGRYRCY
jgi:hypothetical protein